MTTPPRPPDPAATPDPPERGSSADQDHQMPDHLELDELADLTVGELPAEATAQAEAHLAGCPSCSTALARLRSDLDLVGEQLGAVAAAPPPRMPVTVVARLDRALADETARLDRALADETARLDRALAEETAPGAHVLDEHGPGVHPTVLPLRQPSPRTAPTGSYVQQTGVVKVMLVAAVAAVVVGFGGYLASATVGLNEPSALSPTQVQPAALADQARSLARLRDLDPHLFSAAWRCAREVTTGRITGITPVYVDGEQAHLVYTRADGHTHATIVTGCGEGSPRAGDRVTLNE